MRTVQRIEQQGNATRLVAEEAGGITARGSLGGHPHPVMGGRGTNAGRWAAAN
jgi:hypothetical protein